MSTLTFRMVNKKADECVEQVTDGWEWNIYQTRPCDESQGRQVFTVSTGEPTIQEKTADGRVIKSNNGARTIAVTSQNDIGSGGNIVDVRAATEMNGLASFARHGFFHFFNKNGDKVESDIINKGPFKIGGSWPGGRRFHAEDGQGHTAEVIRHFGTESSGDGNDRQLFLNWDLWKRCKARGIPFDDCTSDNLRDCNLEQNKKNFTVCPKEYCTNPWNTMKSECRQWCDGNPGVCDQAAGLYCETDTGKADPSCSCFGKIPETNYTKKLEEQGIILRKECNYTPCVVGNAYKTQSMLSQQCQPINACITGVDIGSIEGNAEISRVNNTCTINSNASTSTGANIQQSRPSSQKTSEDTEDTEDTEEKIAGLPKNMFIILSVVGALVLLILLVAIAR